jgi:hypothetical protein
MMRRLIYGLAFAMLTSVVFAQQPGPQLTPSQVALQIDGVINAWAQQIEALQVANQSAQARIKALEDKYEPKKTEEKK